MKIAIIGLPGSGKSTFAAKLGKKLHTPVHHLDRHMFTAGGKKRDREEFLSIQKTLVHEPSWIIEGCALSSLEVRFAKADEVIYFHFSRFVCLWRMLKRLFHHDTALLDTAEDAPHVFTWEIVRYTWNFDREKRAGIEKLRKAYPQVKFCLLHNSKEAEKYLRKKQTHF